MPGAVASSASGAPAGMVEGPRAAQARTAAIAWRPAMLARRRPCIGRACNQIGRAARRRPMRQVWISRRGGPEVLQVRAAPDPTPAPGEVRVRVHAAGVNFADLMARRGTYLDAPKLPFVPGY